MKKYKSVKKKREQMRKIQIIAVIVVALIFIISVIILLIRKFDLTEDSDSSNLLVEPVNAGKNESTTKESSISETEAETTTITTFDTIIYETQPVIETPVVTIDDEPKEPTFINGVLIVNKSYKLPKDYNPGSLDETVVNAFYHMQEDAKAEGLNIWIASGFRSYEDQDRIYNKYLAREGQEVADTFSARPGYSEHQTGLAFDLNTIDDSFADTREGTWVAENAHKYGFIIRYPKGKESITGYKYEPWHLRYVGTMLATELYNSGLTLEEYFNIKSVYKSN